MEYYRFQQCMVGLLDGLSYLVLARYSYTCQLVPVVGTFSIAYRCFTPTPSAKTTVSVSPQYLHASPQWILCQHYNHKTHTTIASHPLLIATSTRILYDRHHHESQPIWPAFSHPVESTHAILHLNLHFAPPKPPFSPLLSPFLQFLPLLVFSLFSSFLFPPLILPLPHVLLFTVPCMCSDQPRRPTIHPRQPPQSKPTSSTVDPSTTHPPPRISPNPRLTHGCPATHAFIRVFQQKMPTCPSSHWRWPSSQWAARNACTGRSTPS